MIKLFNINDYIIRTSLYDSHLHGSIVSKFENEFCDYVGAKYGCSLSSATNAIFLLFLNKNADVSVPSVIPPVVLNALINSGNRIHLNDDTNWVGGSYLLHSFNDYKVIDSAQRVDRNQFKNEAEDQDVMFFSFYPTKPVGGMDGGIIVSNDKEKIDWIRCAALNGMTFDKDNWNRKIMFPGWKMYMNSVQAEIALNNLQKLDNKKKSLESVRNTFNSMLGYNNTSDHLYRVNVKEREKFQKEMKNLGIETGIHYHATHLSDVYSKYNLSNCDFSSSVRESETTISLPFNENLKKSEILFIADSVLSSGLLEVKR